MIPSILVYLFCFYEPGSVLIHKMPQDLPPSGGFSPLNYKRNLPSKGPSGAVLLTSVAVVIGFGLYMHRKSVYTRMYIYVVTILIIILLQLLF